MSTDNGALKGRFKFSLKVDAASDEILLGASLLPEPLQALDESRLSVILEVDPSEPSIMSEFSESSSFLTLPLPVLFSNKAFTVTLLAYFFLL